MRVLIVSHTYTAPYNRAKLDALAERVTLTAIAPEQWQDTLFALDAEARTNAAYSLHPLPIRFNGRVLRHFYSLRSLSRILAETQPDVVYVEEEPASLALAQFAWLKRNYKLICFTWENILQHAGFPSVERYNLARCDGVMAGNTDAAQIIHAKGFRKPIQVTPQLGVDVPDIQSIPANELRASLGLKHFVVGYFGRLVEEKGLLTLLDAVRELNDSQLLIIGAGALQSELAKRSAEKVRVIPAVPHVQVAHYMRALDAFVLPSQTTPRWKEQFGHVLIEAMACGVPVIGSNSGAIPEVIGNAGLIFPERDANALRNAIAELQSNPARREQLAQAGRARVLANFTHDHIADANVEFFNQVMAS